MIPLDPLQPTIAAATTNIPAGPWRGGTPFIDPLDVHGTWWLTIIPLALFLSIAYKAVRAPSVEGIAFWRSVAILAVQIILGMVALAAALHIFLAIAPHLA